MAEGGEGGQRREGASIETPFLQLVMTRLWAEERTRGSAVLRESTLHQLGDAERIVRTHLDKVMDRLSVAHRDIAAAIFRHLVTPSGMKIAHTAEDLADYAGSVSPQKVTEVLEELASGDERILRPVEPPLDRPSDPRYEIFHDVLAAAVIDWRRHYVAEQARLASERDLVAQQREAEEKHRATPTQLRQSRIISAALVILLIAAITAIGVAKRKGNEANALAELTGSEQRLASDPQPGSRWRCTRTAMAGARRLRRPSGRRSTPTANGCGSRRTLASFTRRTSLLTESSSLRVDRTAS